MYDLKYWGWLEYVSARFAIEFTSFVHTCRWNWIVDDSKQMSQCVINDTHGTHKYNMMPSSRH
jgi:hypothetical protein